MVKIYIDSGHGGKDSGAVGNGLKEKDLTLKLSLKLDKYLRENYSNVETKLSRKTDVYPELSQRAKEANTWKADLFISQHINAGGGTGIETLIQKGVTLTSTTGKVAKEFNDYVVSELNKKGYKITNRGVKNQRNIAVLRESKMTAILPETLFIDTLQDANLLKNDKFLNDVIQVQAEAIAKIYGLKSNNSKPTDNSNNIKDVNKLEEIKKLNDRISELENKLSVIENAEKYRKENDKPNSEEVLNWSKNQGITNGVRPSDYATREQVMTMIKNGLEIKQWEKDLITSLINNIDGLIDSNKWKERIKNNEVGLQTIAFLTFVALAKMNDDK